MKFLRFIFPSETYICTHHAYYSLGASKWIRWALRKNGIRLIREKKFPDPTNHQDILEHDVAKKIAGYSICAATNSFWNEGSDPDEPTQELENELVQNVQHLAFKYAGLINKYKPKGVIFFQGHILEEAVLRHLAIERNMKLLCLERTLRADRLVWDSISGITVNIGEGRLRYERWKDHIPAQDAEKTTRDYIENIKTLKQSEHSSPAESLVWNTKKPKILFLGQVYTDASLLYGLKGFDNPVEVIQSVMQWAKEIDASLIIKLHPKEHNGSNPVTHEAYNDLTYRKLKEVAQHEIDDLGDAIRIDSTNQYDTYNLIEQSDLAVTINSQAGLEASIMGKPVIHGRCCFYGNAGFTYDYTDQHDIKQRLSEALKAGALDPLAAQSFFHIFFEKFCVEISTDTLAKLITGK